MAQAINQCALQSGTLISEYRIREMLGQGSCWTTYLATDTTVGRKVVVKEYFPLALASRDSALAVVMTCTEENRESFKQGLVQFLEAGQRLARFDHPNIVKVRRLFEANGTAYLVTDYYDGASLAVHIKRVGVLSQEQLDRILMALLDGLEQIHREKVLHQAVNPANVYIRSDGSPVLLNVGGAQLMTAQTSPHASELVLDAYSAIEQYSANGKLGPWTDIYGAGASLYGAVTGQQPQDSPGRMAKENLTPAVELAKGRYEESYLKAIDIALRLNPKKRPQSIAQWREVIAGIGAGELSQSASMAPIQQPTAVDTLGPVPKKYWSTAWKNGALVFLFISKTKLAVILFLIVLVALISVTTIPTVFENQADTQKEVIPNPAPAASNVIRSSESFSVQTSVPVAVETDKNNDHVALEKKSVEEKKNIPTIQTPRPEEKRNNEPASVKASKQIAVEQNHKQEDVARTQATQESEDGQGGTQEIPTGMLQSLAPPVVEATSSTSKFSGASTGIGYARLVARMIKTNMRFSSANEIQGNPAVEISIKLFADGRLQDVQIIQSSGYINFDRAVKAAIKKSAPFPKDLATGKVPAELVLSYRPKI